MYALSRRSMLRQRPHDQLGICATIRPTIARSVDEDSGVFLIAAINESRVTRARSCHTMFHKLQSGLAVRAAKWTFKKSAAALHNNTPSRAEAGKRRKDASCNTASQSHRFHIQGSRTKHVRWPAAASGDLSAWRPVSLLAFSVALRDHFLSRGSAQRRGEREASQMSRVTKQVATKPRISPSR